MGRQVHQDRTEEIVMVTVWASIEALYAWVGGRDLLGTPFVYGSDAPDVFATYDVQHYESMDLCPDLDSGLLGVPFWSRDQAS
jgi:hypothetical protein